MNKKRLLLLLMFLIALCMLIILIKIRNKPYEEVMFTVTQGETSEEVLADLQEQGLVTRQQEAINYIYNNDVIFYPNTYLLNNNMTIEELFTVLNNPNSNIEDIEKLVIVEGEQLADIAQDISDLSFINESKEEILAYWNDENNLNNWIKSYDYLTDDIANPDIKYPLEGYIMPATFPMNIEYSLEELTDLLLDNTENTLESNGISVDNIHDLLTLSSIVERETLLSEDKPNVASVFINRLNSDMPLQSDITVLYAMDEQKAQVLNSDLEYESPYNTYLNTGLPPGPIASSSIETINAVLNAPTTNYYYFFAKQDTGEVIFSETYDEHLAVSDEYAWKY